MSKREDYEARVEAFLLPVMEENHFEDNTMLPKIQASVEFVEERPGRRAVITSIGKAKEGYLGKTGTIITA